MPVCRCGVLAACRFRSRTTDSAGRMFRRWSPAGLRTDGTFTRQLATAQPPQPMAPRRNVPNPSLACAAFQKDRRADMPPRPCSRSCGRVPFRPPHADMRCIRQIMREIAFRSCRIRPLPKAAHGRGIKHRLDSPTHPARRFRLFGPDRIEHLHDQGSIPS